jgi:hypothetical protein
MSDKPKPGKDKDLRYIRQAMEETDALLGLFGVLLASEQLNGLSEAVASTTLVAIDQLDLLDQMLNEPTLLPVTVIDNNRQLRNMIKPLLHMKLPASEQQALAKIALVLGNQLKWLLVVKEIRSLY